MTPLPGDPGWLPASLAEVEAAAQAGVLDHERHHLELKRELGSGPSANLELARDLSSFSIDGGLILVGVDEETRPPTIYPVPLDGLPERIEQVGLTRVDEPLPVRSFPLPSSSPERGCLAILIPPSPMAPHMVDGRYYGRNDKTKYALSNDEVSRLVQRREQWSRSAKSLLAREAERDPLPLEDGNGHLFLLAEPVSPRAGSMRSIIEPGGVHPETWQVALIEFVRRASALVPRGPVGFAPDINLATRADRRSNGWALMTAGLAPGRVVEADLRPGSQRFILEVELSEEGGIRIFSGRGTDRFHESTIVIDQLVVGLTRLLLQLAQSVADEAGYWGSWDLGCLLTRVRGAIELHLAEDPVQGPSAPAYTENEYVETTRASNEELRQRTGAVADRIVGRLIRSLGTYNHERVRALLT